MMMQNSQQKKPTIGEFRELLIRVATSAGTIKSADLYTYCSKWGLREGTPDEAYASKKNYIACRLPSVENKEKLIAVAHHIAQDFPSRELEDAIYNLTTSPELLIDPVTRRDILKVLNEVYPLFGDLELFSCLQIISSELIPPTVGIFGDPQMTTLMEDIQKHYQNNVDFTNEELLLRCGGIECVQRRFFELLEKLTSPEVRRDGGQKELVKKLNDILNREHYELTVSRRVAEKYDVYTVIRKQSGHKSRLKNIIFAATKKPDLVLEDAISNDIRIVNANETDALIYDFPLDSSGLLLNDLVGWWSKKHNDEERKKSRNALLLHLKASVDTSDSPGEKALFIVYYKHFHTILSDRLPALLPQVYLHYDPKTIFARGSGRILNRFRMDFLLLLNNNIRIVIEVDGKQHYADNDKASPQKYAEMVCEDRRLRLNGYEVFRFGGAEFKHAQLDCQYENIHHETKSMIQDFFCQLFKKYGVM